MKRIAGSVRRTRWQWRIAAALVMIVALVAAQFTARDPHVNKVLANVTDTSVDAPLAASVDAGTGGTGGVGNPLPTPAVNIGNAGVLEGNTGFTDLAFPATFTAVGSCGARVTAIEFVGTNAADIDDIIDFNPASFQLTGTSLVVQVRGDLIIEQDETFDITIVGAPFGNLAPCPIVDGTASGTITNDDAAPTTAPAASMNDVSLTEGDAGQTTMLFTLVASPDEPCSVNVELVNISTSNGDFINVFTPFTAIAGVGPTAIQVNIKGDTDVGDERDVRTAAQQGDGRRAPRGMRDQ